MSLDDLERDSRVGQIAVHRKEENNVIWPKVKKTDFYTVDDTNDKTIFHSNPRLNCKIVSASSSIIYMQKFENNQTYIFLQL